MKFKVGDRVCWTEKGLVGTVVKEDGSYLCLVKFDNYKTGKLSATRIFRGDNYRWMNPHEIELIQQYSICIIRYGNEVFASEMGDGHMVSYAKAECRSKDMFCAAAIEAFERLMDLKNLKTCDCCKKEMTTDITNEIPIGDETYTVCNDCNGVLKWRCEKEREAL